MPGLARLTKAMFYGAENGRTDRRVAGQCGARPGSAEQCLALHGIAGHCVAVRTKARF